MAQIKKFQNPAGPITVNNYGKIMQNGVSIEVNDDTLLWLDSQGVYGKAIADKLRRGETQVIDTKADGSGLLRNLEVDNPKLTDRQDRRIRGSRGLFEGRRLYNAREEVQHLATYDYKNFIPDTPKKGKFSFTSLTPEYINVDGMSTWSEIESNYEIINRLKSIKTGDKSFVPENKEFAEFDKIKKYYDDLGKTYADKISGFGNIYDYLINKLKTGKADEWDWSVLQRASIAKPQKSISVDTPLTIERALKDLTLDESLAEYFDIDTNGKIIAKQALKDKLRLSNQYAYIFTKDDSDLLGGKDLSGWYILDGKLVKGDSEDWTKFVQGNRWKKFKEYLDSGKWKEASKHVGFYEGIWNDNPDFILQDRKNNLYGLSSEFLFQDWNHKVNLTGLRYNSTKHGVVIPISIHRELRPDRNGLFETKIVVHYKVTDSDGNAKFITESFDDIDAFKRNITDRGISFKQGTSGYKSLQNPIEFSDNKWSISFGNKTLEVKSTERGTQITLYVKNGDNTITTYGGEMQKKSTANMYIHEILTKGNIPDNLIGPNKPFKRLKKGGKILKCQNGTTVGVPTFTKETDWIGGVAPYVELGISGASNRRLEQLEKKAIDKEFLGAMPSMPISTPHTQINTNPFTTRFDKTKTETLSRIREINSGLSDQRLRMANMNANYGHLQKGEEKLYDTMYNHISNTNLQNSNFDLENLKAEKQVADTTRNLAGQAAAKKLRTTAHYDEINRDNFVTMFAELRKQYNDYKAQENLANNWQGYMDLYNQWLKETDEGKKQELANQMQVYKQVMMNGSSNYNPFTWKRYKYTKPKAKAKK